MPKLSLLIPSLYKRTEFLYALLSCISNQDAVCLKETEILISIDGGIKSIGKKRNELLKDARGEYIAYIDDDDMISTDYLEKVFAGIHKGVDHIGVTMQYVPDNGPAEDVKCSKGYVWENKNGIILRSAQHVCVLRKSVVGHVLFPEINHGEDKAWSDLINPLIQTEYLIDEVVYYYNYRSNKNGV